MPDHDSIQAERGTDTISAAARPDNSRLVRALDGALHQAIADQRLVGAVLLVAHDGEIVCNMAAGHADRELGQVMQSNAIFRLASITKAFTTMAAAALLQRGKLQLDSPATAWLPDFKPQLPDGSRPIITIRHLMSHTAGLTYRAFEANGGPYHRAGISDGLESSGISLAENMQRLASAPLLFPPGTAWQYSLATDVLGAVIEKASGLSLPEAIREYVTLPLGMRDTGFTVTDPERLAVPYFNADPAPLRMGEQEHVTFGDMNFHFSPNRIFDTKAYPSGGSGMAGTGEEVLRLLETIRKQGAPLVRPELMRTINSNQIGTSRAQPGIGFGLGWAILLDPQEAQTPQAAGTLNWGGVYGHSWFIDPINRISAVLLTNTAFEGIFGDITKTVRDIIYAHVRE